MDIDIGKRMSNIRQEYGFSQKGMAHRLGMSLRTYQNYEYNLRKIPVEVLFIFCQTVGITLDDFFKNEKKVSESNSESKPCLKATWMQLEEIKEKQNELDEKLTEVIRALSDKASDQDQ